MDDYFQSSQTVTVQHSDHQEFANIQYQPPQDEFDFADTQTTSPSLGFPTSANEINARSSHSQEEDELAVKIRQQQERILEKLRNKSNEEYELKQRRREEGRAALEKFNEGKMKQTQARKEENVKAEELLLAQTRKLNEQAGWKKVAASIKLKQGEYKGKKDVNRMREAIIHKREDQGN